MDGAKGYRNLMVWKKSDELAFQIYEATKNFPKDEIFGIIYQIRRSSVSVPANIVEGYARQSKNEMKRFASIALGSLAETEYYLDFSLRFGYLEKTAHQALQDLRQETGALLWRFHQSLK